MDGIPVYYINIFVNIAGQYTNIIRLVNTLGKYTGTVMCLWIHLGSIAVYLAVCEQNWTIIWYIYVYEHILALPVY